MLVIPPEFSSETARFALYVAPAAGSALDEFGRAWLGRDIEGGGDAPALPVLGLARDRWQALIAAPRHYGFHGTVKAPFALAEGCKVADLFKALASFAEEQRPVQVGKLKPARIAGFLALVPVDECPELDTLAAACVEQFDRFRRPEAPEQVAKRRAGLNARQIALLEHWGYPYVFDEFRFHMTLTERLPAEEAEWLMRELMPALRPALAHPLQINELCLFAQSDRTAPFRLIQRFALTGR